VSDELLELPEGWIWTPFEELVVNHDGRRIPVSSTDRQQRQGSFPYYGASGIIDLVDDYLFEGDYLLIAEDGANLVSRSTPIAFEASGKFWVNNHAHILQPIEELILTPYLRDYFNCTDLRFYISGSAQPKLNQKNLNRIPIPLPPLNEQKRIVAEIEALRERSQKARSALSAIPELCDKFRQSVLAAAFRGDLTADWREQNPDVEPASVLLARIKLERHRRWEAKELERMKTRGKALQNDKWKEKYLELEDSSVLISTDSPQGWTWTTIGHVAECLDSKRVPINKEEREKRQGDVPYYGANGQVGLIDEFIFDEPLVIVVEDETFLGRTKPFCYKITGKSWVNNHAHVLRATEVLDLDYLNYSLMFYPFIPLTSGTTGRRKLTQSALMTAPYALPPLKEQHQIVATIERYFETIERIQEALKSDFDLIDHLDRSILAKAFRGELVEQDPNDEPASVLLERIRVDREQQMQGKIKKPGKKKRTGD